MKILVLAPYYPHSGHSSSGIFNERCVLALKELCDYVEVLVPRPYVPPFLDIHPKWKIYAKINSFETRNDINIYRPPIFQIPQVGNAFWVDLGAYICCRRLVRKLHRHVKFDVIIAFDLMGAGGLAWRIGRDLRIPSCGWATGSDVRVSASSSLGKVVIRAIKKLDLVFYQSYELLELAANLINKSAEEMSSEKHQVLSRGISIPPQLPIEKMRKNIRVKWGVDNEEIVVLSLGRIIKGKGVYELLDAFSSISSFNKDIICVLVGSIPAFDESESVNRKLENDPVLKDRVRIFPACKPDEIWEVFCGADIFAFTSRREGMPNSLLEAMAAGLPAVAFAIPSVEELDAGTASIIKVPPFNTRLFAETILELSESEENRKITGEKGQKYVKKNFQINKNIACALGEISKLVNKCNFH